MKFRRVLIAVILILVIFGQAGTKAYALSEGEDFKSSVNDIISSLDKENKEMVDSEKIFDGRFADIGIGAISKFIEHAVKSFLKNTFKLCGAVVIACLVEKIGELSSGKLSAEIMKLLQMFFITVICYTLVNTLFGALGDFCASLDSLMSSYGVVMGEIFLYGGELTIASTSSAWLAFSLEISRKLSLKGLLPLLKICYCISIASSVTSSDNLKSVSDFIKHIFVTLSVLFMTVLTTIMSFQTVLASATDTVALRGVKFVASNTVPIIGGLVSESLRTLTSAVSLMKSQSGIVCIICLIVCALPPLATVFGIKYSFVFANSFASFIGADTAKGVLSDLSKLINYLIGIIVITTLYFVYFVFLFGNITAGAAG